MPILDAHAHVFPQKIAQKAVESIGEFYGTKLERKGTAEDLIRTGSRAGVSRYLVHSTATKAEQVGAINDYIAAECRLHPEFVGFGALHPDMDDCQAEIDRLIALGLRGIKLHPDFQAFQADDPRMDGAYALCAERGLPILFHAGDARYDFSGPRRLAAVLDRHPRLVMIAAHFGGYSEWEESLELLAGRDLWFDTSSSLWKLEPAKARAILRKHGAGRFLFGSDYPMWDQEGELRRLDVLGLSEAEREDILWNNGASLLGLS